MRRRLRVALLATVVDDFGGIERVLLTLLRHMGMEIELIPVLFTRKEDERNSFLQSLALLNLPYQAIHVDTSRYKYLNPLRNIGDAMARFRAAGVDLIHTHGYRADLIGLVVAKCFHLPIISTCHGFISIDRHLSVYNRLDILLLRYFNRVIAVSEGIKKELVDKGVEEEKVQVITNAVWDGYGSDTEGIRRETRARMGIGEGEFVFGFVGRLSVEKGLDNLLEAAKQWSPRESPWRLVLVGDGPQRDALEQAVRDSGLTGRVLFAGFQRDTAAWYPAMDAFVLPSHMEGTPMALLEAMANGIPVIATSVGGVPAIISSGKNGLLVPSADVAGLLEAMRSVARDLDLRRRLSSSAIDSIRKDYNVDNWIEKMVEAYKATLRQSGKGLHPRSV